MVRTQHFTTEQAHLALTRLTCIREVPGLNLGRVTRSPDSGFNDFPEPVYANARRVPSNRLSRDPSKSLPTHRSWSPFNLIRHCKVSGI